MKLTKANIMSKQYYYIDIDLISMQILDWGISKTASPTGETNDPNIHRVYLTKGQYNKLENLNEPPRSKLRGIKLSFIRSKERGI